MQTTRVLRLHFYIVLPVFDKSKIRLWLVAYPRSIEGLWWQGTARRLLLLLPVCLAMTEMSSTTATTPLVAEGVWGHADIFNEPTDPEMIDYLRKKREGLQNQV